MGYIYKITNKTDGKIYVGQTIQPLDERFRQHRKKGSNCRYLHLRT
jgi:predicted GIY-YIG superfamily endonuclease